MSLEEGSVECMVGGGGRYVCVRVRVCVCLCHCTAVMGELPGRIIMVCANTC